MAPSIGEDFVRWKPPTGGDRTLGLVDFSMFPHLDHEAMPGNSMANAEEWAAGMPVPAYAIDDQTAIQVVDGVVEVVSEGHWKLFTLSRLVRPRAVRASAWLSRSCRVDRRVHRPRPTYSDGIGHVSTVS